MLRKKYAAVLLQDKEEISLNPIKELISFGEIEDATLKELLIKRGKKGKKAIANIDGVIKGLKEGKKLKDLGVNSVFNLHPPRGGFKKSTKLPYPQGVLGKNKDIVKLVKKML